MFRYGGVMAAKSLIKKQTTPFKGVVCAKIRI